MPKPLGTEFKCFVDIITKGMLYFEVQEGKVRRSKKPHLTKLGSTASCAIQSVDVGNNFTSFPDTRKFIPHLHGREPRPKESSSEDKNTILSLDSST